MGVWQHSNGGLAHEDQEERCGIVRASMLANPVLSKSTLGKVKKTTFNNLPADHVFGLSPAHDAESCKAVMGIWQEHTPHGKATPGPDFLAMNKKASKSGLTKATQLHSFRQEHPVHLRKGQDVRRPPSASLPSDRDPSFRYGRPPGARTAEEVRTCGPSDPAMKAIVQGAFQDKWVAHNAAAAAAGAFDARRGYIPPAPTKAVAGHALGATRRLQAATASDGTGGSSSSSSWKMTKFAKVPSRVTAYMQHQDQAHTAEQPTSGSAAEAAADAQQQLDSPAELEQ